MFRYLKRAKSVKRRIKDDPFEVDEFGREIVDITIADCDSILSAYKPDGKKVISNDIAEVISTATKSTTRNKDINLRIACEKYAPEKDIIYKNAIKNYYVNEFADKQQKLHNNTIITLIVFALAIVSFGFLFLVEEFFNLPWIIVEFIDVIAWVFAWETVDLLFFQRQLIKFSSQNDLKIIYAHITFFKVEK